MKPKREGWLCYIDVDRPAPTMMAGGIGGVREHQCRFTVTEPQGTDSIAKPAYQIPSMAEIAAMPKNGYKAVSTFSGCGGSSLGLKWAGFDVLWANEFIPAAQETYVANHPGTLLDTQDIRQITGKDILNACSLSVGELDLFEGSPPCASFSTAGRREASWGQVKKYSDTKQRVDDLFFEWTRLLKEMQPRALVAENVSGLVKGKAKGYFKEILSAIKACGYRVQAQLLDAQWLGVPQARQRIIFIGFREDLGAEPVFPTPLPYHYSVREALDNIKRAWNDTKSVGDVTDKPCATITASSSEQWFAADEEPTSILGYAIGKEWAKLHPGESSDRYINLSRADENKPCPTITQTGGVSGAASVTHPSECRKFTIAELRRLCGFPDDFILTGTRQQQWERLGRAVVPPMYYHVGKSIQEVLDGCAD